MKILTLVIFSVLTLSACNANNNTLVKQQKYQTQKPKNIIMVVADGMGPAYTTAYRYYSDNPNTQEVERTIFDRTLVGAASTYPSSESGLVTDSAAAATALSAGVKSYNGAIAVDINKQPVETVLEFAKQQGKKTGIVVTSQINHATPAAYLTHNESRQNYNQIADSYLDDGIKADVYLGGGWRYFIREDRHLVNEFKSAGFTYVNSYEGLAAVNQQSSVIGLFAEKGLPWSIDDSNQYRLSLMTKAAIKQLENEQGYFLLVEASQVDWAGHSNDIATAMSEMSDLDITMQYLEYYVKHNPDTLVVLTADHSTGGLSIGANGDYKWQPEILRSMTQSPNSVAHALVSNDITQALVSNLLNFDVNKEEIQRLQEVKYLALEALAKYQQIKNADKKDKPNVQASLYTAIRAIINQKTNTGWTSSGHTAVDVPVHAMGANKEVFSGSIDNTDIAKYIFTLLGKEQ